jgi:bifunctional DNase/RNase
MVEMELLGVSVDVPSSTPVMLLREQAEPHRLLPIYIGRPEALAIVSAIEGVTPERPMTHDLFTTVLGEFSAHLTRIVVTEMTNHTYFAQLELASPDGTRQISSRPSDAVALAVRVGAPIFASEAVLDVAGQLPAPAEEKAAEAHAEELVDEFRSFIDQVSPEDFA